MSVIVSISGTWVADFKPIFDVETYQEASATIELRWQQLNAVIGLAIGLVVNEPNDDGCEVIQRWAILKDHHQMK